MLSLFKNWFFPFFLLFTILAEPIFHTYMSVRGISVEPGMLAVLFIGIFIVSMALFLKDCHVGWKGFAVRKVIMILVALLFLYYLSSVFQTGSIAEQYYTYLLTFGSKCIPACLIGMHLARNGNLVLYRVDKLLPFFILIIGFPLGFLGYQAAMVGEVLHNNDETSLHYQAYSYFMAEFYVYSAYYLFFSSERESTAYKWLLIPLLGAMLYFAACCLMGGGRGAFVFDVFATGFIIYEMRRLGRLSNWQIVMILIAISIVFFILADRLGIFASAGFERVINNLTDDSSRVGLRNSALISFWKSPLIGHGIGSVWWEVGFYSHNMITDVLVEAGLVGLVLLICTGYILFKRMFLFCRYNPCYFFLMLMFCEQALKGFFSGYYMGLYHLWLILGLTMILPKSYFASIKNQIQ